MTKHELETATHDVLKTAEQTNDAKEQFSIIWKGTIKPALELVKSFTGPKIDEQISKLEHAADGVCDGTNPDFRNYYSVWNTLHLKSLLKMMQLFTGAKVDQAINKFIEVSESFNPVNELAAVNN